MTAEAGSTLDLPVSFFDRFSETDSSRLRQYYTSFIKSERDTGNDCAIPSTEEGTFLRSVMALVEFYRVNWTGPRTDLLLPSDTKLQALIADGEYPYSQVLRPDLLVDAKAGLDLLSFDLPLIRKWRARAGFLHLRVMEGNLCPSLIDQITNWTSDPSSFTAEECLEAAVMMQVCDREADAENFIRKAQDLIGMGFDLVGRLGRRTVHQSFDVYQLTVQVQNSGNTCCRASEECMGEKAASMPTNIMLNDDHIRDHVQYTDDSSHGVENMISPLQRAILLAHATQQFRFHARDASTTDKISAFLERILDHPSAWQVYSAALFWRSKLETERSRTMERACWQLKALAEQVKDKAQPDRLGYSFLCNFPSDWECEREEGLLFARLGAFKTALDIFERRGMFDEAVQCLLNLGKVQDAQDLVEGRLSQQSNDPRLMCILGEVKREHWNRLLNDSNVTEEAKAEALQSCRDLFQKSWELSGKRLARAQRNLGSVYYVLGEWSQVIAALSLAVAINPLFESSWFLLGLSAVQIKNYPEAIKAFTRVIAINNDCPDAWKNLAFCHVNMQAFEDAFRAMKEVTRLHFDQLDGWMGLFGVALMVGEPLEAIKALQRHVEILQSVSGSFSTTEMADILARLQQLSKLIMSVASSNSLAATSSTYVTPVIRRFHELLEHLMQSALAGSAEFWLIVAEVLEDGTRGKERAEALMKAYRAMQSRPYDRDPAAFKLMVNIVRLIADEELHLSLDDRESVRAIVKRRCRESFEDTAEFKQHLE